MTNAALKNREIESKERIEKDKRLHERNENLKQRTLEREKMGVEADTKIKSAKIGALGSIGGGFAKSFGSLAKNDPIWYKSYIKDLEVFVKIPTYDRLGTIRFQHRYAGNAANNEKYSIPGIISLHWVPMVGPQAPNSTTYFRNPVNQSLARFKEKVLALNSRSNVSWEAADLGYNLFCSADILTMILELRRVIQVYQTYYPKNAYFAKYVIGALGWSFSDVEANFAEYRKTYTILASKFNSAIVAPSAVSLYSRRMFLASNIFVDNDDLSNPRQIYVYVQDYVQLLSDTEDSATQYNAKTRKTTLVQFTAMVQLMISRITDSPSFIEMYQDLRHAVGDKLIKLPVTVEGDSVTLNANPLNREQIHNTMILPFDVNNTPAAPGTAVDNGFALHQDSDGYLYQGKASGSAEDRKFVVSLPTIPISSDHLKEFYDNDALLIANMHKSDVTGDDIIDITRNMFTGRLNADYTAFTVDSCGTEVVYQAYVHSIRDIGGAVAIISENFSSVMLAVDTQCYRMAGILGLTSAFDWCPIRHCICDTGASGSGNGEYSTNMDAFTTFQIAGADLKAIHDACVMGELFITDLGFTH